MIFPPFDTELIALDATDDLLDFIAELMTELAIELRIELATELAIELGADELATEELAMHADTIPNGAGWLLQVLRAIQLFWFSQPQPLCVMTQVG